jgi:hypothetical protein
MDIQPQMSGITRPVRLSWRIGHHCLLVLDLRCRRSASRRRRERARAYLNKERFSADACASSGEARLRVFVSL